MISAISKTMEEYRDSMTDIGTPPPPFPQPRPVGKLRFHLRLTFGRSSASTIRPSSGRKLSDSTSKQTEICNSCKGNNFSPISPSGSKPVGLQDVIDLTKVHYTVVLSRIGLELTLHEHTHTHTHTHEYAHTLMFSRPFVWRELAFQKPIFFSFIRTGRKDQNKNAKWCSF